jgi:hypothetical protein
MIWLLFSVICMFQILDVYQTHMIIELCKCGHELNPMVSWVLQSHGWNGVVIFKAIPMGFLGCMIYLYERKRKFGRT